MEQVSRRSSVFKKRFVFGACCLAGVLAGAGCSGSREAARREASYSHVETPQPPPFLTGTAAMLLTNWPSFSARMEVQSAGLLNNSSGQVLGRGNKLLYAPESGENTGNKHEPGGFAFVWDVAQGRGYVLTEALQGYAPVTAELRVTNFDLVAGTGPMQRQSGHACEPATATIRTVDGEMVFELLRATDLRGFPLKIQARGNASQFVLIFSDVRFEPVSPNVFMPPDGFTLYPNPQAMADELAARQHNFRRKSQPGPPLQDLATPKY
jgi:hypothetical protein